MGQEEVAADPKVEEVVQTAEGVNKDEKPKDKEKTKMTPSQQKAVAIGKSKIQQLIESSGGIVRSGPNLPILHELPKWKGSADLKKAASAPINWAVNNLWTQKGKILLAAEQKTGKTFVVCHAAMCIAAGLPLFGNDRFTVNDPGPVGIVCGEDDEAEMGRRLDRMFRAQGLIMSNYPIHFIEAHRLRLNRERDQEFMRRSVKNMGLKLVIYDPLARLMDGDENSKEIVSAVLNPASSMAVEQGVCVMFVHHLGKQNSDTPRTGVARIRGSSDIASWFSCGLLLSGQMKSGRIDMEVIQRTSGNVPPEFPIDVVEDQEESVHGLGSMRLVAKLEEEEQARAGRNEFLIDDTAEKIDDLLTLKGRRGISMSEIMIHTGAGRTLVNAALKKLLVDEGTAHFVEFEAIPDKKLLMRVDRNEGVDTPSVPAEFTNSASRGHATASAPENEPLPNDPDVAPDEFAKDPYEDDQYEQGTLGLSPDDFR